MLARMTLRAFLSSWGGVGDRLPLLLPGPLHRPQRPVGQNRLMQKKARQGHAPTPREVSTSRHKAPTSLPRSAKAIFRPSRVRRLR